MARHASDTSEAAEDGGNEEELKRCNSTVRNGRMGEKSTVCEGPATDPSSSSSIQIDIVTTEDAIRVKSAVEELTRRTVGDVLRNLVVTDNTTSEKGFLSTQTFNIFAVIGGDGSLGEAVNGLCFGTLQAYRSVFRKESGGGPADRVADSISHYYETLEDRAILRRVLPPMMYVPAGTGSDFAKTKLCCLDGKEFANTLRAVHNYLMLSSGRECSSRNGRCEAYFSVGFPTGASPSEPINDCESSDQVASVSGEASHVAPDAAPHSFSVYDVDISRITFPRSLHARFFINECSCGISCEVITRCEKYKQSCGASFVNGSVLFAIASASSLMRAQPRSFRVFDLPSFPPLPPDMCYQPKMPLVGVLHRHHISTDDTLHDVRNEMTCFNYRNDYSSIIPVDDPLCRGANYYYYSCSEKKSSSSLPVSGLENVDVQTSGRNEVTNPSINPFYANWERRSVSNAGELTFMLGGSDSHESWACFDSSTLVFGNGRWFGGGLQVAPHADPTDGFLSVTNWVTNACQFVTGAVSLYNGNHRWWPNTTMWNVTRCIVDVDAAATHRSKHIGVSPNSDASEGSGCRDGNIGGLLNGEESAVDKIMVCCEADGELCEPLPAVVEVITAVSMILPLRNRI